MQKGTEIEKETKKKEKRWKEEGRKCRMIAKVLFLDYEDACRVYSFLVDGKLRFLVTACENQLYY